MSIIRFNLTTKEIVIEGTDSFVEGIFDKIKELMTASFRGDERLGIRTVPGDEKPMTATQVAEPENNTAITAVIEVGRRRRRRSVAPPVPERPPEMTEQRPPVRKYILRKAGTESNKKTIANVTEEGTGRVSIESLKERLGLTEQQAAEILRDAEKQGRVRKAEDGSYVWVS